MLEEKNSRNVFNFPEGSDGNTLRDEADRIRRNTPPEINQVIDKRTRENIRFYGTQSRETLSHRIVMLEDEWDVERVMGLSAAACALFGLVFGLFKSRVWVLLTWLSVPMLLQFQAQGWSYPLLPLRRLGFRTRQEIDLEKYALKALRGDFHKVVAPAEESAAVARATEAAVNAAKS